MSYELFEQEPIIFIITILISLLITLLSYGAFPIIFAKTRKKNISKKKYSTLCYLVNFFVVFLFIIINGESTGGAYIIWTSVFSAWGIKILDSKDLLDDFNAFSSEEQSSNQIPNNDKKIVNTNDYSQIKFCRKCGNKLLDNANFCNKCGTEIIVEELIK